MTGWIIIHWFELSTLLLLCLNLWFLVSVLNTLNETNRWFSILAHYFDNRRTTGPDKPDRQA